MVKNEEYFSKNKPISEFIEKSNRKLVNLDVSLNSV